MIAATNCNRECDCAQRLIPCQKAKPVKVFEPKIIHSYAVEDGSEFPSCLLLGRDRDGNVIIQVMGHEKGLITINGGGCIPGDIAAISIPAVEWQKFIAACAIDPDLWPGSQWTNNTEVGKPHGGALA